MPKNPFGVRDGKVIVISDLSRETERGFKCNCTCPVCNSALLAKMGDERVYHFAHDKGTCGDTAVIVVSLFLLIKQHIESSGSFHVPSLAAVWQMPANGMNRDNVAKYVRIVREDELNGQRTGKVFISGKACHVTNIEFVYNQQKLAEAVLLEIQLRKLAIRIKPPPSCKYYNADPYMDLPTLVFDASDMDFYTANSESIAKEILGNEHRWRWIANSKIESIYDEVYREYEKQRESSRRDERAHERFDHQAFRSVKHSPVRGNIRCAACGEEKPDSEFFAGMRKNVCSKCRMNDR